MNYENQLNEILNNKFSTDDEKSNELRYILSMMTNQYNIPTVYSAEYKESNHAVIEVFERISAEIIKLDSKRGKKVIDGIAVLNAHRKNETVSVELSVEALAVVQAFSERHYDSAKDNRGTRQPIHVVMDMKKEYVGTLDYEETLDNCKVAITRYGGMTVYDNAFEAIKEHVRLYNDESFDLPFKADTWYDNFYGGKFLAQTVTEYLVGFGITKFMFVEEKNVPEEISYFLIRSQAYEYIEKQEHNLSNPYVYTRTLGDNNNGDLPKIYEMLLTLGEQTKKQVAVAPLKVDRTEAYLAVVESSGLYSLETVDLKPDTLHAENIITGVTFEDAKEVAEIYALRHGMKVFY